jgi:hypothetical protein
MPGMDPAAIERLVSALDAELARRKTKRDAAEDARWQAEFQDDVILFAKRLERWWGRRKPGSKPAQPLDRDSLAAAEDEIIQPIEIAEMVERAEQRREDEAAGIVRRRPKPKLPARSVAKLLADAKPRPDPAAPRPAERTGRRGEALVQPGAPEADGVWQKGMVLSFNPRTLEGTVRAKDGKEYPLAAGCLMKSGLVTLVPGMRAEVRLLGGECDWVRAAWH